MSWGDVWMCSETERPPIDGNGPQAPWVLAATMGRDQQAVLDAVRKMQAKRDSHARSIDFTITARDGQVALSRTSGRKAALTVEPDGLWVAIDLTGRDPLDGPSYAVFTQRVRAAGVKMNPPRSLQGSGRETAQVLSLRAHAAHGAGAIEWAHRAPRL